MDRKFIAGYDANWVDKSVAEKEWDQELLEQWELEQSHPADDSPGNSL